MSFLDRLSELKYTSPSGAVFRPLWDDAERSFSKKVAVHEIPQSDFADVQDLGKETDHFPMTLYFTGVDYDLTADKFYAALGERGAGTLSHHRWGEHRVQVLSAAQAENLVDGLRVASFRVEFIHAPERSALLVTGSTAAAIQSAADALADASTLEASAQMVADNATRLAKMKRTALANVRAAKAKLSTVSSSIDSARRAIDAAGDSIERGIDTLIETPFNLVVASVQLIREPAREALDIKAKIDGYSTLIESGLAALTDGVEQGEAAAIAANLFGLSLACAESITEGEITTRTQAIAARDSLTAAMLSAEAGIQAAEAYGYITAPATLAQLADLRANASAFLLESSFLLPFERVYTCPAETTALDLAWKLLGDIERMDEIIDLNGLGGLVVIPPGTEVRYYA